MTSDQVRRVAAAGLDRPRSAGHGRPRSTFRRELVVFLTVAMVAMLAIAAAITVIGSRIARDSALEQAEVAAQRLATQLLEPLLPDALADRPGAREALDHVIEARLNDGTLALVVVWTPQGRVLYSSAPELEGQERRPGPDLSEAAAGHANAHIGTPDVGDALRADEPLIEVYQPFAIGDRPLVFEAYFTTDEFERDIALLRGDIVPLAVGAVALLQLVQIPIVVSLGRRLRRKEAERLALVHQHLAASDRERRMIAADVHDGPVQDLTGVTLALQALRPSTPENKHASVDRMLTAVRNSVVSLRRLIVDIYPPDLNGRGLPAAIEDLAGPLVVKGMTVHRGARALPGMSSATAEVLYRTSREALANVSRHARANTVWICLEGSELDGVPAVQLTVEDDGVGLPPRDGRSGSGEEPRSEVHLGLRLVRDRVVEQGGSITVENRPGGGTVLRAVVPAGQ